MNQRFRTLARTAVLTGFMALSGGCLHTDSLKKAENANSPPKAAGAEASATQPKTDGAVQQAGAVVAAPAASSAAMSWLTGKAELGKNAATDLQVLWQQRLGTLPDPTRNGSAGVGLVGQMFLTGVGYEAVPLNGKLVVEMFDISAVPPGANPSEPPPSSRIGGWTLDKHTLRRMATMDERFGLKSYALFLPWPDYRPSVTRVHLKVRYEPEHGHPLYTPPTQLTIDTTTGRGGPIDGPVAGTWSRPASGVAQAGFSAPAPVTFNPVPIGGPAPAR